MLPTGRLFTLIALAACTSAAEQPARAADATLDPDSAAAHAEALAWLALVDAQDWQASFDRAAPLLRQMTGSPSSWGAFVRGARTRYPVAGERRVVRWEPDYVAHGAPPGDYARITFTSGPAANAESIVLARGDGAWRVAMYSIGG